MESCRVPIAGHIVIDNNGSSTICEYEYASFDPEALADLLLRGFEIDAEGINSVS